jgi:hypothetical protein
MRGKLRSVGSTAAIVLGAVALTAHAQAPAPATPASSVARPPASGSSTQPADRPLFKPLAAVSAPSAWVAPASAPSTLAAASASPLKPSPAGAVAPSASVAPSAKAGAPGALPRPFGPGFSVEVESSKPFVYIYVAKGAVDTTPSYPDPFVKVGRLPVTIELPSGVYTLLAEGESVPTGSTVFEVRDRPVHVRVQGGSQPLRDTSTLLMAVGGIAVLAGLVVQLSRVAGEDSRQKNSIAIPLYVGGGIGLVSGITMFVVARTKLESDGFVPSTHGAALPGVGVSGRF